MDTEALERTARKIVAPGKGILAADESTPTMGKRLQAVGAESTAESRRFYRGLLFTTEGSESAISGVILYDETIRQRGDDGRPFPEIMHSRGILPGIKVDTGAKELAGHPGEKVTEGLDGLRERCAEYYQLGARFAKWRAVITIGDGIPPDACISVNAHALARYAAICQEQGLVPVIEPEVLMDGEHDIDTCAAVTARTLEATYAECHSQGVHLPGTLLKPNMVLSGLQCSTQAGVDEVARRTVDCLMAHVPHDVQGIVFLSGGQSDELATAHLNAMNALDEEHPWELSYSYGRALQASALQAGAGKGENAAAAQAALAHRAQMNSLARSGDWSPELEP